MSIQAGIWNLDGAVADTTRLENMSRSAAQYGPDGQSIYADGPIAMLYRPFHTTKESRLEAQPNVSSLGIAITWDGRLDNGAELAAELSLDPQAKRADVDIVAASFRRWGDQCFSKLVGDWAAAIWSPQERTITLAVDYMGIRHLYYYATPSRLVWSNDLASLVLLSGNCFHLDDEYVADFLALYPQPDHTPYREIQAVRPGRFVSFRDGKASVHSHWAFRPQSSIHYKTDAEYEDHFRHVFRQSVRRRLRADRRILSELSGGLDSSSIVCMADAIMAEEGVDNHNLDTLSFYDLDEPEGDDLCYLTKIEAKRGRPGHHIDVGRLPISLSLKLDDFAPLPSAIHTSPELKQEHDKILKDARYRVVLSGIGGDEMLGGVPDPKAQLADLIVQFRLVQFTRSTAAWSLVKRKPWIQLALQAGSVLLPAVARARMTQEGEVAPWIDQRFARQTGLAARQLGPMERFGFWLPSQMEYARMVMSMSDQMARVMPSVGEEHRYPYLDQNLVEFLVAIPKEQLLRPGERRSLMRRSLAAIVPPEVLARRTKATTARRPALAIDRSWNDLEQVLASSLVAQLGYVDQPRFTNALRAMKNGDTSNLVRIMRTLCLELWLRDMAARKLIHTPQPRPVLAERTHNLPRSQHPVNVGGEP
jgi:asparagine synthase (glutamine-hydrolysing)